MWVVGLLLSRLRNGVSIDGMKWMIVIVLCWMFCSIFCGFFLVLGGNSDRWVLVKFY